MARLLIVVESASPLTDFSCRVHWLGDRPHLLQTPGIVLEPGEIFRPGDGLILKRPDGSTLLAQIGGFLEIGYNSALQGRWVNYDSCIAVPDLNPYDVPSGPEVWSVDPPQRSGDEMTPARIRDPGTNSRPMPPARHHRREPSGERSDDPGPLPGSEAKATWLSSGYSFDMPECPRGKATNRKLRLLACACCRMVWGLLESQYSRDAVETSERYADGLVAAEELSAAASKAPRGRKSRGSWISWDKVHLGPSAQAERSVIAATREDAADAAWLRTANASIRSEGQFSATASPPRRSARTATFGAGWWRL